jgi:hypothetical protein
MEQTIQLSPLPNQEVDFNYGDNNFTINLRTLKNGILIFDLKRNEKQVCCGVLCHNNYPLLINNNIVEGNFLFRDTKGSTDPFYTGLGNRYQLIFKSI